MSCYAVDKNTKQKRWHIIPATAEHIPYIAAHMREVDRREVWASSRHTPTKALESSLKYADMAWTCLVDGQPGFMWGVSRRTLLSLTGIPWLLGTETIRRVDREFIRQSRSYVEQMQAPFFLLENYVHAENTLSMRWLVWCGFTIDHTPLSSNGEPFYRFWRK